MGFPERLRLYRKERGLSQRELARELGVSHALIARYERGDRRPSFEALCMMGDYFGVPITSLVEQTPEELTLTDEEQALILAWRAADETHRQIALGVLHMTGHDG